MESSDNNKRETSHYITVSENEKVVVEGSPSEKKVAVFPAKNYPPGYRFMPTDEELILHYLQKKVDDEPIPLGEITEIYLRRNNPQSLADNNPKLGENEWYFFSPRDRKYPNGKRPDRAADIGYWKATGADKPIFYQKKIIGYRKVLVFYEGKPPKGVKTSWIMHEFRLYKEEEPSVPDKRRSKTTPPKTGPHMRLDEWVLCRIYKKAFRPNNRNRQGDESNPSVAVNIHGDDAMDEGMDNRCQADNEAGPAVDVSGNDVFTPDELLAGGYVHQLPFQNYQIPPQYSYEEPMLINSHIQQPVLDYGMVNLINQDQYNFSNQVQHNTFHQGEEAYGYQQGFDFHHQPMYFNPSSSNTTTTTTIDFHHQPMYFNPSSTNTTTTTIDFHNQPIYFNPSSTNTTTIDFHNQPMYFNPSSTNTTTTTIDFHHPPMNFDPSSSNNTTTVNFHHQPMNFDPSSSNNTNTVNFHHEPMYFDPSCSNNTTTAAHFYGEPMYFDPSGSNNTTTAAHFHGEPMYFDPSCSNNTNTTFHNDSYIDDSFFNIEDYKQEFTSMDGRF